jgi:insulysin
LQCLLVSDSLAVGEVGVEAGAVHVQAGHFDDSIPGLSHFNEHLLFLGSEKFPEEDEYETFLSSNGGYSNAYTDMEDTNYYFSVTTENQSREKTSEALQGALDRLAQFFIAPRFDPDAVDREIKAIDSEYRNGRTSDNWRSFQFLKSLCDPRHPFAKFGCGNNETLLVPPREELLSELHRFWEDYYQSYNMRLTVVGHASLDALQRTVEETFGQVPFSEGQHRRIKSVEGQMFERENALYNVKAFPSDRLGVWHQVVPLTETRSLKVHFAVPPLDDPLIQKSKPHRLLSHLLGHESPGSLHALLNEEGYVRSLSSGVSIDTHDFGLFAVSLTLTAKGMANKQKILDLLFQWIAFVRQNQKSLKGYQDELKAMSAMTFRFRETGDPVDFCSSASELQFDTSIPPERFLHGNDLDDVDFDEDSTNAFFERLRPENAMIVETNSDLVPDETWQTERWYGAISKSTPLAAEQVKAWEFPAHFDERLHMPALNAYIPTDFSLRCDDDSENAERELVKEEELAILPEVLVDEPSLRMWHKMDRFWRIPKTSVRLSILSNHAYSSPRAITYNRIFQRVLNDDLNSFVYDASMAGCNYRVTCIPTGYRISVRGYSQKLPFLLDTLSARILSILDEMKAGDDVLREKFEKARQSLLQETKNFRLDPPNEVANYNSRLIMEEKAYYLDDYVNEMEGEMADNFPLTMEECADYLREGMLGKTKIEAMCMGNIDKVAAVDVAGLIRTRFLNTGRPLSEVEIPNFRSLRLPTVSEATKLFNRSFNRSIPLVYADIAQSSSEENNAADIVLQVGSELDLGYEGLAIFDLICHMAYGSAYNQLRTNEQLGYIVSAFARKTVGNAWGMSVVVQGGVALPEQIEERVEAWLMKFRQELESMKPAAIVGEAQAVVSQLLEVETRLSQEVNRVWGEILNTEGLPQDLRTPAFDRLERLAEVLDVDVSDGEASVQLKSTVLEFFDKHFAAASPDRRAMSSRVYSQRNQQQYENAKLQAGVLSSFSDITRMKRFLSAYPSVPYWRVDKSATAVPAEE